MTARLTFIVRFRPGHPIGKAQALAARGKFVAASRMARAAQSRADIKGLCFDRFTVGGAETVLRPCTPSLATDAAAITSVWLEKLRASALVEYADANVAVDTEKKPR